MDNKNKIVIIGHIGAPYIGRHIVASQMNKDVVIVDGAKITFPEKLNEPGELFFDGKPVPHSQIIIPGPAASRNALCPCGSGKKYKKCCLK